MSSYCQVNLTISSLKILFQRKKTESKVKILLLESSSEN